MQPKYALPSYGFFLSEKSHKLRETSHALLLLTPHLHQLYELQHHGQQLLVLHPLHLSSDSGKYGDKMTNT